MITNLYIFVSETCITHHQLTTSSYVLHYSYDKVLSQCPKRYFKFEKLFPRESHVTGFFFIIFRNFSLFLFKFFIQKSYNVQLVSYIKKVYSISRVNQDFIYLLVLSSELSYGKTSHINYAHCFYYFYKKKQSSLFFSKVLYNSRKLEFN